MILKHRDRVLLYKSGSEASLVAGVTRGLEPYSEFYASQIATCLGFSHVDYNIVGAAPIFDNGYGLFSLADVPLVTAKNDFSPLTTFLHGKHPALFDHWIGFTSSLKGLSV